MVGRVQQIFRVLTLLCISCMAIAATVVGAGPLGRYRELATGTLLYYTVSLVVGGALLLHELLALRLPPRLRKVAVGGLAGLALGINQLIGLRFSTILCFTPG